nr:hypothetical protein [Dehalococcoidia bacterium]
APKPATVSASPANAHPGGPLTVSGSGFSPNSTVSLTVTYIAPDGTQYPQPAYNVTANSAGSFSGTGILPANAYLGDYLIGAQDGDGHSASTSFTIS